MENDELKSVTFIIIVRVDSLVFYNYDKMEFYYDKMGLNDCITVFSDVLAEFDNEMNYF